MHLPHVTRLVAATTAAIALTVPVIAATAMSYAPPPPSPETTTTTRPRPTTTTRPATTTTRPDPPDVIVQPTTTRPETTTTTTTQPPVQVATTASTTPNDVAQPAPPTTVAEVQLAPATTAGLLVAQETTTTTEPQTSGEPVALGAMSTDPGDWSAEVLQYLQAEGFDLDELANQSATAAGTPDQLVSNEGCAVNCITSGLAWAVGVGAYLEVTTSVPAIIRIQVLDATPENQMTWEYQKLYGATWPDLQQNTTYDALAYAIDGDGNVAIASGEFTTRGRYAAVTLTPTAFTTWDPTGPVAATALGFAYGWLDGDGVSIEGPVDLLELVYPKAAVTTSIVTVIYKGLDGGICPGLDWVISPIPDDVSGSIECGENGSGTHGVYGAVAADIQLDGYPDDSTSWTGHDFTFPLSTFYGQPQEPPMYVAIDVTVQVWYE